MFIEPSSVCTLYSNIPITKGRQIVFSSEQKQRDYFNKMATVRNTDLTYVRRTGAIRLEVGLSTVKNCNYISFSNPAFENKTFYARIIDYNYVNNGCTEIFYQIDYFQSFMFDVEFSNAQMVREQLNVRDYNKSLQNPYDYSIVEFRTGEDIAVPEDCYKYPVLAKQYRDNRVNESGTRKFYPAANDDAVNDLIYVMSLSLPVSDLVYEPGVNHRPGKITSVSSTIPSEDMAEILSQAGLEYAFAGVGPVVGQLGVAVEQWYNGTTDRVNTEMKWLLNVTDTAAGGATTGAFGIITNTIYNNPIANLTLGFAYKGAVTKVLEILARNNATSAIIGMHIMSLSTAKLVLEGTSKYSLDFGQPDSGTNAVDPIALPDVISMKLNPIFSNVKNKKLLQFPYQYITISTPSGNSHEYRFEDFTNLQSVQSSDASDYEVAFCGIADVSTKPVMTLAPYMYKIDTESPNGFRSLVNILERIDITEYPEVAYQTDAYLTAVASAYQAQLMQEPTANERLTTYDLASAKYLSDWDKTNTAIDLGVAEFKPWIEFGLTLLGGLKNKSVDFDIGSMKYATRNSATTLVSALSMDTPRLDTVHYNMALQNSAANSINQEYNAKANATALRREALDWASDGTIGSFLSSTKPAYRTPNYFGGSNSGMFANFFTGTRFTVDIKTLKDEVLKRFDEYFTNYGYRSVRSGVPYVANFLAGKTDGTECKFLENEDGYQVTYAQCTDLKISGTMTLICEFFETLFSAGCQFINGDTL